MRNLHTHTHTHTAQHIIPGFLTYLTTCGSTITENNHRSILSRTFIISISIITITTTTTTTDIIIITII